jgi:hypothetical protein
MITAIQPRTWQPGDLTAITCPFSIHQGRRVELISRHLGAISGRPWWRLRLEHNGAIASEFEDSLSMEEHQS